MRFKEIVKEESFKIYLSTQYHKLCKKLDIAKYYEKRISEKYWFKLYDIHMSPIKNLKDFENRIFFLYIRVLFEDLRLVQEVYYKDTYMNDYMIKHSDDIATLDRLLYNRTYSDLVFKKIFLLKNTLNELFTNLDIVAKYEINERINPEKDADALRIKEEIYNKFNSFFEAVNVFNNVE